MRAYEILLEGGNAFPDVGTIHISEIEPTLKALADMLGMPNVADQALGSVGKAEYSGDIDVALDLDREAMKELSHDLRNKLGSQNVTGVAGNVNLSFPIQNYDDSKQGRQPRTGKVQIDLIPGEPSWMKTFYHSAGDESKMKGIHRNFMINAIARTLDREESEELDDFERPVATVYWAWGPKNGLVKARKTSRRNERTGKTVKKQDIELLSEPVKDPAKIAEVLFGGKAGPEALNSFESLFDAVKKAFPKKQQNEVFQQVANMLENDGLKDGYKYPKEISQYFS